MKVLFVGLGSIGQRHLRNLRRICGDNLEILAYRQRGLQRTFTDNMQIRDGVDLEQEYNIRSFNDLQTALREQPQICIISNVTNAHIPCALQAAKAGCHLFLEKPISDTMEGVKELFEIVNEKHLKVFVGFQNRYHPALQIAKDCLRNHTLGNILAVHAEVGERLSTMHTYEDYRETYMARKDLGGGVILNQMIHEIDYLQFLFGRPDKLFALGSLGKDLSVDVDDSCSAILSFEGIPVTLHGDFYQYPPQRTLTIIGSRGKLHADIIGNRIQIVQGNDVQEKVFDHFVRNDMFVEEMEKFLQCVENDGIPEIGLTDGIAALQVALAIKQSVIENGKCIMLGGVSSCLS